MMFEVDWSDFGSERVGQRRARKETDHEVKKQDMPAAAEPASGKTPPPESKPTLSLFGSIGLKRNSLSVRSKKKDLPAIDVAKVDGKPKRRSLLSPRSATISTVSTTTRSSVMSDQSFVALTVGGNNCTDGMHAKWEDPVDRSSKESMLSKSTCITIPNTGPHGEGPSRSQENLNTKLVQSLDDAVSYVVPTAETTYEESRGSIRGDAAVGIDTSIVTESMKAQPTVFSPPPSSATAPSNPEKSVSEFISDWHDSISTSSMQMSTAVSQHETRIESVGKILLPPITHSASSSPRTPSSDTKKSSYTVIPPLRHPKLRINGAAAWKPPDSSKTTLDRMEPHTPESKQAGSPKSDIMYEATLEAMAIQREIKRVGFATLQVILARLNEDWGNTKDPMIYAQLETEKKRWMLSAMYRLGHRIQPGIPETLVTPTTPCRPDTQSKMATSVASGPPRTSLGSMKPFLKGPRILSLFDSQSTTAYLAALHSDDTLTHVSPLPLHNLLYPNIRPLYSAVTSSLSFSDNSYMSVHSLSMPSLLAGQEVPRLLKGIRRCLTSRGALHMILIDPSPASRSLGPKLREWLDQNLIIHLEAEFRCISPSRLFPRWLKDARLRGEGSTVTKVQFPAVFHQDANGNINGSEEGTSPIKTELQSVVGRMLWQEVWGKAVRGNLWWWDDQECVEECIQYGTYFEYFLIEAVKED